MLHDQMISRKDGGVGWMIFNNPQRHNALTPAMFEGIDEILRDFEADREVRVCVMAGAGDKAFVSGADIAQLPDGPTAAPAPRPAGGRAFDALGSFSKPLIAMIQGWCLGGGVAVALKADMRIAATTSRFGIPAARLGIAYPLESIRDLVAVTGPSLAKSILFTAERLDADQALRTGLVDEVVAPEALEARVREIAAAISDNAPLSVRAAKAAINHFAHGAGNTEALAELSAACFASADYKEGREAFLQKRRPVFTGR
jgi:enoyl-CoA hydratase